MMQLTDQSQRDYFSPALPRFWRWTNGGAEIETVSDPPHLLVFRDELLPLLEALKSRGWPELAPIILLIAASRDQWPTLRGIVRRSLEADRMNPNALDDLFERLNRIHRLPARLRTASDARIRLARYVLEECPSVLPASETDAALLILNVLQPAKDTQDAPGSEITARRLSVSWIKPFLQGLERVSVEALDLQEATGLAAKLLPAAIPAPPVLPESSETHAARLWTWSNDPELYGVARIARRLLTILSWPRNLSESHELPLGGISDITNRGPLDRLLLSELALDDDALMVRIALNEALYLRRETPRDQSPQQRAVFVDTGLRLWGRPRVFAAAVALAIAAGEDRERALTVAVTIATRAGCRMIDVSTRAGALELLGELTSTLHPAAALMEWSEQLRREEYVGERVIVTTPAVLQQPEFLQALSGFSTNYRVLLVDGAGNYESRSHTAHGWRSEQTATLDLDELLEPPTATRSPSLSTGLHDRLPAIMRVQPFPLLLSQQFVVQEVFPAGKQSIVSLAPGGRVLLWENPDRGGREIAVNLPRGRVETWSTVGNVTRALIRSRKWVLLTIDTDQRTCQATELATSWSPGNPQIQGLLLPECVVLLAPTKKEMVAFDDATGQPAVTTYYDGSGRLLFFGNRYFRRTGGEWLRLYWDSQLGYERMERPEALLLLDDHSGFGSQVSPMSIPQNGVSQGDITRVPQVGFSKLEQFRQIGTFVVLSGRFTALNGIPAAPYHQIATWNLQDPTQGWVGSPTAPNADLHAVVHDRIIAKLRIRQPLRTKFTDVVTGPGRFALMAPKGRKLSFRFEQQHLRLKPESQSVSTGTSSTTRLIPLERVRSISGAIQWQTARLSNGTTVWFDSRGLLHLLPADVQQPEITLVLDEANVSGWLTDGRQFGDAYYHTNSLGSFTGVLTAEAAWRTLIAPMLGVDP